MENNLVIPELNYFEEDQDNTEEIEDQDDVLDEEKNLEDEAEETDGPDDDSEEEDDEDEDSDLDEPSSDESEIVSPLFNMLHHRNFFFHKDEKELKEPKTLDEFIELFNERNSEYDKRVQESTSTRLLGRFPTRMQKVAQAIMTNPEPITDDLFLELVTTAYESESAGITEGDLDDEDKAAKYLIAKFVKDGEFSESIAEDIIAGLKDEGKLKAKAKAEFNKDKSTSNSVLDKFVAKVNENVKVKEETEAKRVEQFNKALDSTGWSKQKVEAIKKDYASGVLPAKIKALINNPNLLPYLLEFASYTDGEKMYFDKYKQHAFAPTKAKVVKEITDKSFFRTNKKKSTTRVNKDEDFTIAGGIELVTN